MLAITIANAEVVAIGRLVSRHDTTVVRGPSFSNATFGVVRMHVNRWLKGKQAHPNLTFSWLWRQEAEDEGSPGPGHRTPEGDMSGWGPVIVYLDDAHNDPLAPRDTWLGAIQRTSPWVARPGSDRSLRSGLEPCDSALEAQVLLEIARQTPDALVRSASHILLVRADTTADPGADPPHGYNRPGRRFRVLHAYKGATLSDRIRILMFPQAISWQSNSQFLVFLREVVRLGNSYEPIRLDAGVVEVKNGRVPAWNCTFDQAVARIRAAR